MPAFADVADLPPITANIVSVDMIDNNGHANVRGYYDNAIRAADLMLHSVGINEEYRNLCRASAFGAEHHVSFLSELHLHDQFSCRGLWLELTRRSAHLVVFVLDDVNTSVSCIVEIVVVNVSLETRHAQDFSDNVAATITDAIARTNSLDWARTFDTVLALRARA